MRLRCEKLARAFRPRATPANRQPCNMCFYYCEIKARELQPCQVSLHKVFCVLWENKVLLLVASAGRSQASGSQVVTHPVILGLWELSHLFILPTLLGWFWRWTYPAVSVSFLPEDKWPARVFYPHHQSQTLFKGPVLDIWLHWPGLHWQKLHILLMNTSSKTFLRFESQLFTYM